MHIKPITTRFVADIEGVDVRSISAAAFATLYQAWLDYGVLRLRNQAINEDELQAFSALFGPLEEIPMGRLPEEARRKIKNRYVTQLSNIIENGKPIGGLGNSEAAWHSDMTYVEEPPPDAPEPEFDDIDIDNAINIAAPTVEAGISLGLGGLSPSDGEYLPIVKVAPIYPRRAQQRGLEGHCIVAFVVTKNGSVRDPAIVECSSPLFAKSSMKAVLKFKYKPRVNDGVAVEVPGVQNKFTYTLEK